MNPVDKRLLEVVGAMLERPITISEARDLRESYQFILNREWRMARVMNLLWLARKTRDWEWMAELAKEYRKVLKLY